MDESGFRAVVAMADVMLDTLHWSGGNTSLDALAVGTPIVTLPGEFMRGRQTQAMLRAMGLDELVVATREAYVDRAIEVARDTGLRARALANRGAVFARPEAVAALSEHLQRVVEARRT
jgi:CRISPR-associated protein Csy1